MGASKKVTIPRQKAQLYPIHAHCFPGSSWALHTEGIIVTHHFTGRDTISQGEGTCPGSHSRQKQTQDCVSQLPLLPTLPTGPPCSLWHAPRLARRRHSVIIALFPSPEPAAQGLALRSRERRQRSQGEGPILQWFGNSESLPPLAPTPGCLSPPGHLPSTHSSTDHSCKLDSGACSQRCRHQAPSAEPDTVSAFKLFAVSGEDQ